MPPETMFTTVQIETAFYSKKKKIVPLTSLNSVFFGLSRLIQTQFKESDNTVFKNPISRCCEHNNHHLLPLDPLKDVPYILTLTYIWEQ